MEAEGRNTIKKWRVEERPREKLVRLGAGAVTNAELLAILLQSGTTDRTAVDIAREIIDDAGGSLNFLSGFSIEKLKRISGIGPAKAVTIQACFELAKRMSAEIPKEEPTITSSEMVVRIMAPLLQNLPHEECWVLFLNKANKLICKEKISSGGIDQTTMDIRIIAGKALDRLACGVILVHNHPSGNRFPGDADKARTIALKKALSVFDIALLDHIIVAGKKYFSFSDENY
ncbi:MAG: DNA repair protein RadC [Bacteroidales bacterium]|nr:DNA repair protein RadC [Candidatus Cacconaster merdequi]